MLAQTLGGFWLRGGKCLAARYAALACSFSHHNQHAAHGWTLRSFSYLLKINRFCAILVSDMNEIVVEFVASAFRHGISKENILHAFRNYWYDGLLKNNEDKYLRLGVDRVGNLLEIVYHEIDDRTDIIFHAMKCQSKYYHLLKR
ncbi:MAG: hypothetical protein Ta2A_26930 [Treponemataceae bacterium]|nr:MAG: hypothetical protein Ta2A_26930 [Treponemataceae bacterium]